MIYSKMLLRTQVIIGWDSAFILCINHLQFNDWFELKITNFSTFGYPYYL
jgi:hypothetical protein